MQAHRFPSTVVVLCALTGVNATSSASFTGYVGVAYTVEAEDFGGSAVQAFVLDLYMTSDDAADTLLNIYNVNISYGPGSYFQSFTGTGWIPTNLGGPFDTEALQVADSFVTIGGFGADGRQAPGAGAGTGLDPNFGANTAAAPGVDAGWYNSSPPSLNGAVMDYDAVSSAVLIGRFATVASECSDPPFDLTDISLEATWNQGLGTPGQQAQFTITGGGYGGCFLNFDLDRSGTVDGADLGIWLSLVGSGCTGPRGDFNDDGELSGADLGLLLDAWGTVCEGRAAFDPSLKARIERCLPPRARLLGITRGVARPMTPPLASESLHVDLDGNGSVDAADRDAWLQAAQRNDRASADLNGDGEISGADLGIMLGNWGPCR